MFFLKDWFFKRRMKSQKSGAFREQIRKRLIIWKATKRSEKLCNVERFEKTDRFEFCNFRSLSFSPNRIPKFYRALKKIRDFFRLGIKLSPKKIEKTTLCFSKKNLGKIEVFSGFFLGFSKGRTPGRVIKNALVSNIFQTNLMTRPCMRPFVRKFGFFQEMRTLFSRKCCKRPHTWSRHQVKI